MGIQAARGRADAVLCTTGVALARLFLDRDPSQKESGNVGPGRERGTVISTDATFAFWKSANGCDLPNVITGFVPAQLPNQSTIDISTARGCMADTPTRILTVKGGGYQLPRRASGTPSRRISALLGPTNTNIDGIAELWNFLAPLRRR